LNKVLDADTLKPIADEVARSDDADGFAGGGTRNIFANKPAQPGRDEGPRPHRARPSERFRGVGMSPTVIAYDDLQRSRTA
jgi:hypothetical protein